MKFLNAKIGKRKFFTILELFIVIAIISIIMAVIFMALSEYQARARDTQRLAELREIQHAIELYHLDHGKYPTRDASGFGWYYQTDTASWTSLMSILKKYLPRPITGPNLNPAHQYYLFSNGKDYKVRVRLERPSHDMVDPLYDGGKRSDTGGIFNKPESCAGSSGEPSYEKAVYTLGGACFGI